MATFKDKLILFMRGRYGIDQLNTGLLVTNAVFLVANMFAQSMILGILTWILIGYSLFRTYSRNLEARRRENEFYLKLTKPVRKGLSHTLRRIKEARTHRFRTCPSCKAFIKMPNRKGKRTIVCPKCGTSFEASIWI